jgi:glutathione synthase/RimK-type ligase-like ATP-grasp enzyme
MLENIDWRIENVEELPHKIVELPKVVSERLKKMLSIMNLNFGAFDLIRDETGTYYFIEVNPNGQYFWMELLTGAPLSDAMVNLILRLCRL